MARQIKRFLHSELKHVSEWTYVLILAIYACMVILQLNSFPMWFCSLREGSFLGFSQTRRLNCRQRTPFYLVMQRFFAACCSMWPRWLMHCSFRLSRLVEEPWGLSEARGGKRACVTVARVMLSSFALLGAFILSSVVLYCLNCAIVLDAQQYFNLNMFCDRLLLASAVCLAYVVSCVIVVSYF